MTAMIAGNNQQGSIYLTKDLPVPSALMKVAAGLKTSQVSNTTANIQQNALKKHKYIRVPNAAQSSTFLVREIAPPMISIKKNKAKCETQVEMEFPSKACITSNLELQY